MLYFKKIYNKINWRNKKEGGTPLNEVNLGKMDNALDNLDDEMVACGDAVDDLEYRLGTNYYTKNEIYTKDDVYPKSDVYTKDEADAKFGEPYELPKATKTTLGGLIVGDGLSVNDDGVVSADAQPVDVASKTNAGIVKIGDGIEVTADGTISAKGGGGTSLPEIEISDTEPTDENIKLFIDLSEDYPTVEPKYANQVIYNDTNVEFVLDKHTEDIAKVNENLSNIISITNYEILDSSVSQVNAKKNGKHIECTFNFKPTKTSLLVIKLPTPVSPRYYIPVFNFDTGKAISGGLWFTENGTLQYFGDVSSSNHVAHIEYLTNS